MMILLIALMTFCTKNSEDLNNQSQSKGLFLPLVGLTAAAVGGVGVYTALQNAVKQPVTGASSPIPTSTNIKSSTIGGSETSNTVGVGVSNSTIPKTGYIPRDSNPCIVPYCGKGDIKTLKGQNLKTESFIDYPITQKDKDICDGKVPNSARVLIGGVNSRWSDFEACIPRLNVRHVYSCYVRVCLMGRTLDQVSSMEETMDKPLVLLSKPFISTAKDPELGMYAGCTNPSKYKTCRNDYDIVTCNSNFCFGSAP